MKKLLIVILIGLVSCSKEIDTPITKTETIKQNAIACQCNNNSIIFSKNMVENGKPIVKIDTSECSKPQKGIIYIKTWVWINGMPQANNTTSSFTYTYLGFKKYIFSVEELNIARNLPVTTSNSKQVINGTAPLPCNNNGKLSQSVYCTGTTQYNNPCGNQTLSCNYRCYLHGGN